MSALAVGSEIQSIVAGEVSCRQAWTHTHTRTNEGRKCPQNEIENLEMEKVANRETLQTLCIYFLIFKIVYYPLLEEKQIEVTNYQTDPAMLTFRDIPAPSLTH